MFSPFPFVIFWPFVQILYLATSKLLPNYLKKLVSLPLIFYYWITFFLLPVHSSSLPHLFSPFLCLRSILLHFFTLFYTGEVYVLFQHTLLSLIPYFALFNWSCRIFVSRMTMKKKGKKGKRMQWWKHVPFHSNCSLSWIALPLFSNRTCISKLGNSHQSVWQNFPVFFSEGVHFSNASSIPLQNFPGVTAWFEGLLFKSLSSKKAIWNRRIKTDYLHSINQNKTITNAFQNIAIIIFYRLINCWTSFLWALVGNL